MAKNGEPQFVEIPMSKDDSLTPYQLPFPTEALEEIVVPDAAALDEREWVQQAKNVWFRPLCLNRSKC